MTSEFVYIRVAFNALLLTKGSSSSAPGVCLGLRACVEAKGGHFKLNFKDKFRMIVSMTVSNFVKNICQILTILH